MSSHGTGLWGEALARDYLKRRGMRVLQSRYRAEGGEIDLVARDGKTLCFVEVKYRPQGRLGEGVQAVTGDKWARIRRAACAYLAARGTAVRYRYDIVEITRAGVWHIKDAAPERRNP